MNKNNIFSVNLETVFCLFKDVIIDIPQVNPYIVGYIMYFFMKSCAMSAYLNGCNPFNQPGVEIYKKNMFALLGKKM